ncbi:MAG: MlaD family protein [Solirubrobacterales bacterium]
MRGTGSRLAANPTMVGAVTVLVATLAVFLAYNANNGLPFVPSYRISAQVPEANTLLPGNEVRIGGVRVGVVDAVEPQQAEDGELSVKLDLALDADVEELPADSTVVVRARSALGLKYLEIGRGSSDEGFAEGSIMPLSAAQVEPVEIDQVLNTFDEPTQEAIQDNLVEFGNALAARGPALNSAIGRLNELLPNLEAVMTNLAAPATRLDRFFPALARTAAEVAPVAAEQARMFGSLDTTFGALANVARPYIQDTISESVPTLEVATRTLPRLRPFLAHSAALFADLEPGIEALRANGPTIATALEIGGPILADSKRLNRQLAPTAQALEDFSNDAGVNGGLDRLDETAEILTPALRFIAPAQTVCGYAGIALNNLASLTSHYNGTGTFQRFEVFEPALGADSEGSPSDEPANTTVPNLLHYNPYPNTASPGQAPVECEAGKEGWVLSQAIGNVAGDQGISTDPDFQR